MLFEDSIDDLEEEKEEDDDEDEDDEEEDDDEKDDEEDDEAVIKAHDAADYVDEKHDNDDEDNLGMYVDEEAELDVMLSRMENTLDINQIPANGSSKATGGHICGKALGNSAKMADLANIDIPQEPEPVLGLDATVNPLSDRPLTTFAHPAMSPLTAVINALLQDHLPALKDCNPLVQVWTRFGNAPCWLSYGILSNIKSPKYHGPSWVIDESSTYMLHVLFQLSPLSTPSSSIPVAASPQVPFSHHSLSIAATSSSSCSGSLHTNTTNEMNSHTKVSQDAIITFLNLDPTMAQKIPTKSSTKLTYQCWFHYMEKKQELANLKQWITVNLEGLRICSLFPDLQEWFTNPSPDPSLTTALWKGQKPGFLTLRKFYIEQGLVQDEGTGIRIIQAKLTSLVDTKNRRYEEYQAVLDLEGEEEKKREREKQREEKRKRKEKEKEKGKKDDDMSMNDL
ncbi:hypothetical protein BJ165DRAFT_1405769 [Panaeolus papilionaceus]|nr:hypothetical protein BJ165DRAFT_1405769 [Panaeolus papilionaceus]